MKKYRPYRVPLFIALLGFNTLSACVNTKQELGCASCCHNLGFTYSSLPKNKKRCLWATLPGVVFLVYLYHLASNPSNAVGPSINNNGTTSLGPMNFTTMSPSDIDKINETVTQALDEGEKKWGDGSSTESPSSSTTTEGTTTIQNTTTEQPSSTTTAQPSDGVPSVKDSMKLDDEIVEYLITHPWSPEALLPLLNKGLNINAKDKLGLTLLMRAAIADINGQESFNKTKSFINFLINKGANVNAQDQNGSTALMLSGYMYLQLDRVKFLIENGADPCIKDKKGDTLRSLLESKTTKDLSKSVAIIEYLDTLQRKCA